MGGRCVFSGAGNRKQSEHTDGRVTESSHPTPRMTGVESGGESTQRNELNTRGPFFLFHRRGRNQSVGVHGGDGFLVGGFLSTRADRR